MRFALALPGSCAVFLACSSPEASPPADSAEDLGVLVERISGTTFESLSDTLEQDQRASRGPFAVELGHELRVTLSGTGDADLYVRFNSRPTPSSYDCRPYADTSSEQCVLTVPAGATSVYVDVQAYTACSYSLRIESGPAGEVGAQRGEGGVQRSGESALRDEESVPRSEGSVQRNETVAQDSRRSGPFVIAVLGSSTAEGEGASSHERSWVGLLAAELNVEVINHAAGGYSTLELLPGSGDDVDGTVLEAIAEDPDLIVIALAGGNDISRGTPPESYVTRLGEARGIAEDAGIPTFFVGTAPKNVSDEERAQLGQWNEQMRSRFSSCWTPSDAAHSPCFIDVMAHLGNGEGEIAPEYDAGDGIHINDEGHHVVFSQAADVIATYVCAATECR